MIKKLIHSTYSPLWVVLLVQAILVFLVFQPFFLLGEDALFCASYDGLKNYYTYYTYLLQEAAVPWSFYEGMQYPFGEYIFFTDNTPTLSVPLKWISDNIVDLTPYSFRIFNWFCLLGFLASTFFSWLIIKRLTHHIWLWSILAITLPWITGQVFRLGIGHFNLSFSWTYLAVFYLLIRLYDNRDSFKKVVLISLLLVVVVYLIAFVHLYYLPMLCVVIGTVGLVIAILNHKNYKKLLGWLSFSGIVPLVSLGSVWLTLRTVDTYYDLRKKVEGSYNWGEWNLKIDGFYSNYEFSTIPFLFKTKLVLNGESYAYLGAFALYATVFLLLWLIYKTIKNRRHFFGAFKTYFSGDKGTVAVLIFLAGLMCLNIAIGEYAKMFNNKLSFDNPLHPFKYIRLLAGEVTQFRVLARFQWVCFWAFNFTLIYLVDRLLYLRRKIWMTTLAAILIGFSIIDMADMQGLVIKEKKDNILLHEAAREPYKALLKDINIDNYQAILPLPFYMIGSEDPDMMLNVNDKWRTETFLLALETDLPLMASTLSRSALVHHEALLSIFTQEGYNDYLKKHLYEKPILVFMTIDDTPWATPCDNESTQNYLDYGKQVPAQYDMKLLKKQGDWILYSWEVN